MKTYKYILMGLLGAMSLGSCTDLDEQPYTFVNPAQFYKNESQLSEALNSVYAQFRNYNGNYMNIMRLEDCTEFGQPNRGPKEDNQNINDWYDINSGSTSSTFINLWNRAYTCINRCNTVLARGEGVNMDATAKARIYAQARFMRAYSLFYLVRIFGGVPIPEGYTSSLEGLEIPRKTVSEVYDYIQADLDYCESNLPERGASSYDAWRISKGATEALLGEIWLYRASMESNTEYYRKSAEYNKKVIDTGTYSLMSNYKDLWYAFNPAGAKNNQESILELQYSAISGQDNSMHRFFGTFGDSYYNVAGGSYFYLRTGPSIYAYESYSDNDARKQVFITSGSARKGTKDTHMEFVAADKGHFPGSKGWQSCTPGNAKYYDFTTAASLLMSANNFMLIRYSEVLLNYAEALNQVNGGSAEALKYLNMVHQRAGLPALSLATKSAIDDAIFQERGWEFIGEGKMYFDELRTNRLGKNVYEFINKGVVEGMNYFRKLNFVPQKSFLWKIPKSDLDSNPALVQNPDNVTDPAYPLQ